MKIPLKLIRSSYLKDEAKYLLILAVFYKRNLINKKKLLGQIKTIKDKSFLKKRNLHHFKLANIDVWEERMSPFDILELELRGDYGGLKQQYNDLEITFEDLLECVKLYLSSDGMNHNYCVNYIYYEYLSNMLTYEYYKWLGIKANFYSFKDAVEYNYLDSGYCCSCCSGSYEDYCKMNYENYIENTVKDLDVLLKQKLNKWKKQIKNLTKNVQNI